MKLQSPTCFDAFIVDVMKKVPFNEAVRFYFHVPLTERLTKTKLYRAECPWCNAGTLEVSPINKIMWCMECKKGGDLLLAIAQAEDTTIVGAVLRLMERYSIDWESCHECRSPSSSR